MEFYYKSAALLSDGKILLGDLNSYYIIDFNNLKEIFKEDNTIFITGIKKNKIVNPESVLFKNYFNFNTIPFQTGE